MQISRLLPTACALLVLAACTATTPKFTVEPETSSSSSMVSSVASSDAVTNNVSYIGIVEQAGISIYMQGTHRLTLADGRFVLLESSTVTLSDAVGKKAEVFGAVRPTVEAGGIIMNVERLTILEDTSSEESSSSSDAAASVASTSSIAELSSAPSSAAASRAASSVSSVSSAPMSSSTQEVSTVTVNDQMLIHANVMSAEDLSAERWTQQYCSSHIGFCLPIHKNWWFKSFGTTASALWHVEISDAPIDVISSGPIIVTVRSGTVESRKATDGQVRVQGDTVAGFRSWTENRYFEIVAPRVLEGAVQYLTKNITIYETE